MIVEISNDSIAAVTALIHAKLNQLAAIDPGAWITQEYIDLENAAIALNSGV